MTAYTPGEPCPSCGHALDEHIAFGTGYVVLCPVKRCTCVATWQWNIDGPPTINFDNTHDTNGPSTSA